MSFLKRKFFDLTGYYFKKHDSAPEKVQKDKLQLYSEKIYHLLSWEDTTFTLVIFLILNYLFWLMVIWEIRIVGILFSLALLLFIYDSFLMNVDQLESSKQCDDVLEFLQIIIYDSIFNLRSFRKENPSTFCITASLTFFSLHVIARNLSGAVIFYLALLLIFFIPLVFKLLPEETAELYKNYIKSLFNTRGVLAEEELIPFLYDKEFSTRDADLDSLMTDRTADSLSTSLISGISTMPSYLEVGDIQVDVQEEDLIPNRQGLSLTSYDLSSESDSDHKEMSFTSTHLSDDSSSDNERFLDQNTTFTIDADDSGKSNLLPGLLSNITSLGNQLVANILKPSEPIKRQNSSSSSSTSEFEFVNKEDLKP